MTFFDRFTDERRRLAHEKFMETIDGESLLPHVPFEHAVEERATMHGMSLSAIDRHYAGECSEALSEQVQYVMAHDAALYEQYTHLLAISALYEQVFNAVFDYYDPAHARPHPRALLNQLAVIEDQVAASEWVNKPSVVTLADELLRRIDGSRVDYDGDVELPDHAGILTQQISQAALTAVMRGLEGKEERPVSKDANLRRHPWTQRFQRQPAPEITGLGEHNHDARPFRFQPAMVKLAAYVETSLRQNPAMMQQMEMLSHINRGLRKQPGYMHAASLQAVVQHDLHRRHRDVPLFRLNEAEDHVKKARKHLREFPHHRALVVAITMIDFGKEQAVEAALHAYHGLSMGVRVRPQDEQPEAVAHEAFAREFAGRKRRIMAILEAEQCPQSYCQQVKADLGRIELKASEAVANCYKLAQEESQRVGR